MKNIYKLLAILISVVCLAGCGNGKSTTETSEQNIIEDEVDDNGTYTILVYMVGSDLESQGGCASSDILEMMKSGVDLEKTNIVLCTGGTTEWAIGFPNDRTTINQIVEANGELAIQEVGAFDTNVNMGEADTLSEFLQYGYDNYKTDHYALICWDHGGGPISGYGNDELFGYDCLEFDELKLAMDNSPFNENNKLDWIGFDACLMASIEIADLFSHYADYLIASEETEPGCGWDYSFLSTINETSSSTKIAKSIIDSYENYILENTSVLYQPDMTLSCMKLSEIQAVTEAMDALFVKLNESLEAGRYQQLSQIRSDTKAFQKGSGLDLVDLGHTAQMVSDLYTKESAVLMEAIENFVIYQATNLASTYGVSVYYPYESQEQYNRVDSLQVNEEAGTDLLYSSEGYSSYFENYADIWINGEPSTEWETNLLELAAVDVSEGTQTGEELTVQLSDEQMREFAEAYYTIYCDYGDDDYTPILMNCRIAPDEKGVLRVSLNQNLIVGTSGEPGVKEAFWMFKEAEHREDGVLYKSVNTAVSGPFGVFSSNATYEPVEVNVFESKDGEMFINSINYKYDTAAPDGKQTVNLAHWDTISNVFNGYHPAYDEDGNILSYKHWKKDDGIYAREVPLENLQFEKRNISEFNEAFVCQVTVVDIYGNEYSTNLEKMHQDEYPISHSENTSDGKFEWELYEDYAKLKSYVGDAVELTVPEMVEGLPVAAIDSYAFNKGNSLEKILLPESVAMLDGYCFANCDLLQTVELSNNISKIPESAFDNCSSLIIVELPESVKQIGRFAFMECDALKSIVIPSSVETISAGVFYGCDYLQKVEVVDSNPYYVSLEGVLYTKDMRKLVAAPSLFRNSYTIPEGVEEIADFAFADCYMEKISGDKVIGYGLTEIKLPETLKVIGDGAFLGCKRFASIELPNSLEMIGSIAFGDDSMFTSGGKKRAEKTKLSTVKIGDNLSWIGDGAFMLYGVEEFVVSEKNQYFSTNGKELFNKNGTSEIDIFMK